MTAADGYALKKLQEVEATYPVIMKPTGEVGDSCYVPTHADHALFTTGDSTE